MGEDLHLLAAEHARHMLGIRRPLPTARKVWHVGTQMIPRLGAGSPHFSLRLEPARIIEAACPDADEVSARRGRRKERRSALAAKGSVRRVSAVGGERVALRLASQ